LSLREARVSGIRKSGLAKSAAYLAIGLFLAVQPATAVPREGEHQHTLAPVHPMPSHDAPVAHEGHGSHLGGVTDHGKADPGMAWPTAEDADAIQGQPEPPTTFGARVLAWLGAWHPAVIHFPIALPVTVGLLELLAWSRRTPRYIANNQILLCVGVAGALVAASVGWAGAGLPSAEDDWALTTHRWLGSALPFLLLLVWNAGRLVAPTESGGRSRSYCVLLIVSVFLILVQGYLGGEVTHGANHMAF